MPLKIQRDDQTSLNLTPMIDVVFLLLIFFMVSSHFTKANDVERDITVKVPQVTNAGAITAAPRSRVIDIFADGRISLDKDVVSMGELESKLIDAKKSYQKMGVIVRGDKKCFHQRACEIYAMCNRIKIQNLKIAVELRTADASAVGLTESR